MFQLFNDTKKFMKTVSRLVMQDSGMTFSDAELDQKSQEFADDVFAFESNLANVLCSFFSK